MYSVQITRDVSLTLDPLIDFEAGDLSAVAAKSAFEANISPGTLGELAFVLRESPYDPDDHRLLHRLPPPVDPVTLVPDDDGGGLAPSRWTGGYVYLINPLTGEYLCSLDYFYRTRTLRRFDDADRFSSSAATRFRHPDDAVNNAMLWNKFVAAKQQGCARTLDDLADYAAAVGNKLLSVYPSPEEGRDYGLWVTRILVGDRFSERQLWSALVDDDDDSCPEIVHQAACLLYGPTVYCLYSPLNEATNGKEVPVANYPFDQNEVFRLLAPLFKTPKVYAPTFYDFTTDAAGPLLGILEAFRLVADFWLSLLFTDPVTVKAAQSLAITEKLTVTSDFNNNVFTEEGGNVKVIKRKGGDLALSYLLTKPLGKLQSAGDWEAVFTLAGVPTCSMSQRLVTACRTSYAYGNDTLSRFGNNFFAITRGMRKRAAYVTRACESCDWLDFALETCCNDGAWLYSDDGSLKESTAANLDANSNRVPLFSNRTYDDDFKAAVVVPVIKHAYQRLRSMLLSPGVWGKILVPNVGFVGAARTDCSIGPLASVVYYRLHYLNNLFPKNSSTVFSEEKVLQLMDLCESKTAARRSSMRRSLQTLFESEISNVTAQMAQRRVSDLHPSDCFLQEVWSA